MTRLHRPIAGAVVGALLLSACESATTAPCDTSGAGTLTLNIAGLPAGVDAAVTVVGPGGTFNLTESQTLAALAGGAYTITSAPVAIADSTVSPYLRGVVPAGAVCVRDAETRTVNITHQAIGSSGKVWVGAGFYSLGFTTAQLGVTATLGPAVVSGTRGGVGAAFDRDGNLWVRGQTTAEPYLMRYSAASLAATANPTPDRAINISGVTCEGASALAFDEAGNLWISVGCQQRVVQLAAALLVGSGTALPTRQITNLVNPEGLAFDAAGNLWVADATHLRRFDAARLSANISTAADLRVTFTTPSPPAPGAEELGVYHLAFSPTGELWVSTYGQNALYRVEAAVVAATGTQATEVTRIIYMTSFATPRSFAFDNSGAIMIGYNTTTFARFAPTQLQASVLLPSVATPTKIYASAAIFGYADGVAMFPAPAGTPLYSRAR